MPTTLPTLKLATPPASSSPRFKSTLLTASDSGLVQEVRALSGIYSNIAAEWADTTDYESWFQTVEPQMRELLLGVKSVTDQLSRKDLQSEAQFAVHDFDTAALYSREDFAMANMYVRYALLKIHDVLEQVAHEIIGKTKLGYGYDTSGEVQRGGGTSGEGRHLWDTGNAPKHDHTQNNPANMMYDADAESDYPELREFKHKRVHWPPRTR